MEDKVCIHDIQMSLRLLVRLNESKKWEIAYWAQFRNLKTLKMSLNSILWLIQFRSFVLISTDWYKQSFLAFSVANIRVRLVRFQKLEKVIPSRIFAELLLSNSMG